MLNPQPNQHQINNSKPNNTNTNVNSTALIKTNNIKKDHPGKNVFKVKDNVFIVDDRYEFIKLIGVGAYGVVCSAFDRVSNSKVAIKKVPKAFEDLIDAKRIYREIKLLQFFDHANIVALADVQRPPARTGYEDIYLITELMETDLHKVIYSKQDLTDDHLQFFMYQILKGTHYMHEANVIHRDLKPSNLLLNKKCDLKICDFGLSRGYNTDPNELYTEYVVTRWYRAPEVILNAKKYNEKLDVWSIGCILAELLSRTPLLPGNDYLDQVHRIVNLVGTPTDADMAFIGNDSARKYIKKLPHQTRKDFRKLFPSASAQCLDLLGHLLVFNPNSRWSVRQCLEHKWFEGMYHPDDISSKGCKFDWSIDDFKPELKPLQSKVYEESLKYHPEVDLSEQERKEYKAIKTTMQSIDINSDNITKELNNFINHTNGVIGGKSGKEKEEHDAKDRIDNRNASVDRDNERGRHNIYRNTGGQKYKDNKESKDKENPTNIKTQSRNYRSERVVGGEERNLSKSMNQAKFREQLDRERQSLLSQANSHNMQADLINLKSNSAMNEYNTFQNNTNANANTHTHTQSSLNNQSKPLTKQLKNNSQLSSYNVLKHKSDRPERKNVYSTNGNSTGNGNGKSNMQQVPQVYDSIAVHNTHSTSANPPLNASNTSNTNTTSANPQHPVPQSNVQANLHNKYRPSNHITNSIQKLGNQMRDNNSRMARRTNLSKAHSSNPNAHSHSLSNSIDVSKKTLSGIQAINQSIKFNMRDRSRDRDKLPRERSELERSRETREISLDKEVKRRKNRNELTRSSDTLKRSGNSIISKNMYTIY